MIGYGSRNGKDWGSTGEVYPSDHNKSLLAGPPKGYSGGSLAFIGSSLQYCGGKDPEKPDAKPMRKCYFLKPPHTQWEKGFALLQVRNF